METTVFNPSTTQFQGFGVNVINNNSTTLSNYTAPFSLNWSRLHLKTENPGAMGIYYTDAEFDNLWLTSPDIVSGRTRFAYSVLQNACTNVILTMDDAKCSFLSVDGCCGNNKLTGDSLVAYARFWASAVVVHQSLGLTVNWLELCETIRIKEQCDSGKGNSGYYITPSDYVVLIQTFKSIVTARGVALGSNAVQVMGP
jgi:hypothetical protein